MYELAPNHEFFVGIDSDGCVFDSMELKHKECFIPTMIKSYRWQGISKYVRQVAEFVNLYSTTRGINRFPGLVETMKWLQQRPEVSARGVTIEIPQALVDWISNETKLGNPTLTVKVEETGNADLLQALQWSIEVNRSIASMVEGVPPFPFVRESLEKLRGTADLLVVSSTPTDTLRKEWNEHGIDTLVIDICGQEAGSKKETLRNAASYGRDKALMIGDAPGDLKAAKANNCLFFPINPGKEEASWAALFAEGIERFLDGRFAGQYQDDLVAEFETYLPATPSW